MPRQRKNSTARGRVVIAVLLMAMTAAGLVVAVRWQLGRFKSGENLVRDDHAITLPDDRVRLARIPEITTALDSPEAMAEDYLEGAEDGHLGKPVLQPRTLHAVPPAPARASVDPEIQAPEDPRDFELPAQDHAASRR